MANPAQLPVQTLSELASIRRRAKKLERGSRELAQDVGRLETRLSQLGIGLEIVQPKHNDQEVTHD